MILQELLRDLMIAIEDEVSEALNKGQDEARFKWFTNDGYFYIQSVKNSDEVHISCYSNDKKEKHCPNLCAYLMNELGKKVFWEKSLLYHGKWGVTGGLDPAFGSWEDYYDYKFG